MAHPASKKSWRFDNSYVSLPAELYTRQAPEPVPEPKLLLWNEALASELGLDTLTAMSEDDLAEQLSGNALPTGADPIAQAYAGHQFGHFTMLGDGRAVLLGEHLTPEGKRWDIQLKGSGQTPYSRRGDGRATLNSMLREYLISEAMHALGIPSSRSLAVIKTGLPVHREDMHEGAVLTRVSASHIRVGTFEYIHQFLGEATLATFTDYVIDRHYPALKDADNPARQLFEAVFRKQIELTIHWMRVGFIHGVMNTDNVSIAGESFDYGPCAFMNAYDPNTVFSSIDRRGRYAFGNQPPITHWNVTVFGGTLLPLIDSDEKKAIELAQETLHTLQTLFLDAFYTMMGHKIGLPHIQDTDRGLIDDLLAMLEATRADYTNTFIALSTGQAIPLQDAPDFQNWKTRWEQRLAPVGREQAQAIMQAHNPAFIPRNHLVEQALENAVLGDWHAFEALLQKVRRPYHYDEQTALERVPEDFDQTYQTFCGT